MFWVLATHDSFLSQSSREAIRPLAILVGLEVQAKWEKSTAWRDEEDESAKQHAADCAKQSRSCCSMRRS
ncbi:hypothetical protein RMSM_00891 [Rhodopirellula maiorica SM1]|uniref:Uncharacterized protein n=1 Tax=Rhodopirellula maiorica SM1 TaxID=1265738 RepID=M5S7M1_9BACT|nr:hypothetical protein RMSM_00891 [Rhodopirellula maiorica SM1]